MFVTWESLKAFAAARSLAIQYYDDGDHYHVWAECEGMLVQAVVNKDSGAEQVEFEADYKDDGNVATRPSINSTAATDVANASGAQGAVSVTNAATLIASNGSSNLASRKTLTAFNNSGTEATLYWGYTNAVTTSTGTPLVYGQFISWALGASVSIYMIAASSTHNVRVTEVA